ncbi:hypothetical protein [Maricaulis sp.]|uniref:hypothetical protein n=1 Tax=Maricaulis sp. TaxID=1486257 RepID=UPI003A9372FD
MDMIEVGVSALRERWPELLSAGAIGSLSWFWTRMLTRRRIGQRIAAELFATQVALKHRADPSSGWRQHDSRAEWMLEPYVRRVDFLQGLAVAEGLSADVAEAVADYQHRMQEFIRIWANAKRRSGDFTAAYRQTSEALARALTGLRRSRRYRSRLAALALPPRDNGAVAPDAGVAPT